MQSFAMLLFRIQISLLSNMNYTGLVFSIEFINEWFTYEPRFWLRGLYGCIPLIVCPCSTVYPNVENSLYVIMSSYKM